MARAHEPRADKAWRDAIRRAVNKRATKDGGKTLDGLADALVTKALGGDVAALKEIGDRLDGKATQALQHGGHDGGPVTYTLQWGETGEGDKDK